MILKENFSFRGEYTYSLTFTKLVLNLSKMTLDHFTKTFVDLLNILKGAGAPINELNKVIFFSTRWSLAPR